MQYHDHVNFSNAQWRSCRSVTLRDGVLTCSLEEQSYDLTQAYENDLHIRLANAKTDDDLIAFVRGWGPLYLTEEEERSGVAYLPLSRVRVTQRWLRALLDLLNAFKRAEDEKAALKEFISAECEYERNSPFPQVPPEPIALSSLRSRFGISGNVLEWVKGRNIKAVRAATDFLVPFAQVGPGFAHFTLRRQQHRRVEATWMAPLSLEDSLRWMIWYDEYTKHPLVCCPECRNVFRAETAHARKYCSYKCGHREAARNWQRKKRKAEKHVTRKTR